MRACDKIITFGSTIGVEAAYWGKPSILLGRAHYEDLNCCYILQTYDVLFEMIERPLFSKPKMNAIMYGYWQIAAGIDFEKFRPEYYFGVRKHFKKDIFPHLGFTRKMLIRLKWNVVKLKKFSLRYHMLLPIKRKLVGRGRERE
jgi:hypothetical protein